MSDANRPAVFLDKDGTLVEDVPYNADPARVRLMPGAAEGLRSLQAAGFVLIVVTNQSGVARGLFPESALQAVDAAVRELLKASGVNLAGFYYCPHLPPAELADGEPACACRKPAPGLLRQAALDHGLDLSASWFVGDIADDVVAGRRAGCRTVLVPAPGTEPYAAALADFVARDLKEAAAIILRESVARATRPRSTAGALT